MRRAWLLMLALLLVAPATDAVARKASYGEFVKAARAVRDWDMVEARAQTKALQARDPDAPETRYLVAQLAFLEGRYAEAREGLEGLAGVASMKDLVDELLPVVKGTEEVTTGYASHETEHFTILYPPGKDEVLVELAGEALEKAYERIGEDLGWKPTDRIRVEIYPAIGDLATVSPLTAAEIETSGTIALCKYNKLMVVSPRATVFGYAWMDTLAHEYVHFAVSSVTGNKVPIWLHEGIAKFEETRWRAEPAEVGLGPAYRHLLAVALTKKRLVTFEEMHPSMAKLPSQEAASTAFAEVYTMIEFLHGKLGYAGLRDVLGRIRGGKSERRAIAEVLGTTWPEVEGRWKQFLDREYKKVVRKGPRLKRLYFVMGDEGDEENVGLDQVSEEKARRFARLGGLLRARGHLRAAATEYEKALAVTGPGEPFVAGKLARTWLELGEPRRAVEVALPVVEADPEDAYPRATLGAAYLELGELDRAETHLMAAVRVTPFDPSTRCGLADVYTRQGKTGPAEREASACRMLR